MRESISITTIFQIFILFVLLFTAIMCLTINNSNAFGVKDSIVNAIEALDGNYLDGADLKEEIVQVIQETSYRTSGKCPDGFDGFDRAGNSVGSNSSDAAVCIKEVDVTGGIDKNLSGFAQDDFVDGKYYRVVLFFQLDIPVFKQIFNFETIGETRIIYNTIDYINDDIIVDSSDDLPDSTYTNKGNLDSREPTRGDDSNVNPVRNPGVSSSGGGNTTQDPEEEEEEETPQLTCNTEGLNLDTKLAGVQAVVLGQDLNQGKHGLLFTEQELATQITRMPAGSVITIQGSAAGKETTMYVNYNGQCGWIDGSHIGIDIQGYANAIGAKIQVNIYNSSSSKFTANGKNITGVTGRALYSGMQFAPLQYKFAVEVGKAALAANAGGDTLEIVETYRPLSVTKKVYPLFEDTVNSDPELRSYFSGVNLTTLFASNNSEHNRACAIDVTLVGKTMPTTIHDLNRAAKTHSSELDRYFANTALRSSAEWWHFDTGSTGANSYCIQLDSDFWSAM